MKIDRTGTLLLQLWRELMLQNEEYKMVLDEYEQRIESLEGRALTDTRIYKEYLRRFETPPTWKLRLSPKISPKTVRALEYSPLIKIIPATINNMTKFRISPRWRKDPKEEEVEIEYSEHAVVPEMDKESLIIFHELSLKELLRYTVPFMVIQMRVQLALETDKDGDYAEIERMRAKYLAAHTNMVEDLKGTLDSLLKEAEKERFQKILEILRKEPTSSDQAEEQTSSNPEEQLQEKPEDLKEESTSSFQEEVAISSNLRKIQIVDDKNVFSDKLLFQIYLNIMREDEDDAEILARYEEKFGKLDGAALEDTHLYKNYLCHFEIPESWVFKRSPWNQGVSERLLCILLFASFSSNCSIELSEGWKENPSEEIEIDISITICKKEGMVIEKIESLDSFRLNLVIKTLLIEQMRFAIDEEDYKEMLEQQKQKCITSFKENVQSINMTADVVRKLANMM